MLVGIKTPQNGSPSLKAQTIQCEKHTEYEIKSKRQHSHTHKKITTKTVPLSVILIHRPMRQEMLNSQIQSNLIKLQIPKATCTNTQNESLSQSLSHLLNYYFILIYNNNFFFQTFFYMCAFTAMFCFSILILPNEHILCEEKKKRMDNVRIVITDRSVVNV